MEVTVVRLNRPLLLAFGKYKDDYIYQTIYGYIIKQPIQDVNPKRVNEYVGYLAAMHLYFNGSGEDFSISREPRGVPDWVDETGTPHLKYDTWMGRICKKSTKKLGLSYTTIPMTLDEKIFSQYVNQDMMIIAEYFYWSIEEYLSGSEPEQPLGEEDDLPF